MTSTDGEPSVAKHGSSIELASCLPVHGKRLATALVMAARKYDYTDDEDYGTALGTCLHDQVQRARPASVSISRFDVGTRMRSGVVPIRRSGAPTAPIIPRAALVPEFVVGERISAFALHAPARQFPIAALVVATLMFLVMTVLVAVAYYR